MVHPNSESKAGARRVAQQDKCEKLDQAVGNKTNRIMDKWDIISWTGLFTKQLDLGSRARGSTVTENGIKAKVKCGQAEVCNTLVLKILNIFNYTQKS